LLSSGGNWDQENSDGVEEGLALRMREF